MMRMSLSVLITAWRSLEVFLQHLKAGADEEDIPNHQCARDDCNSACILIGTLVARHAAQTHPQHIWPAMSATLPDVCSLAHVPIVPVAARGSADASIIRRHLAALAPAWRLGIDHAKALPACVRSNATYADFLRNDTFYIQ